MAKPPTQRRGILLLVVLSLLVLFVLVGVTFMVTASQYRRAAASAARIGRSGDTPKTLMDITIRQIVRDTHDSRSGLFGQSLLRDHYGDDGAKHTISPAIPVTSSTNQFTRFQFVTNVNDRPTGYYNGAVLTYTSGPAAGESTRVIRYINNFNPTTNTGVGTLVVVNTDHAPTNFDEFVLNGIPFNGTGAGYSSIPEYSTAGGSSETQPVTFGLDSVLPIQGNTALPSLGTPYFMAHLPIYSHYGSMVDSNWPIASADPVMITPEDVWRGGMDEPYDVADLQNLLLAWVPTDLSRQQQPLNGITTATQLSHLIPSMHRPALAKYWLTQIQTELGITDIRILTDPNNAYWTAHPLEAVAVRRILRGVIARPTKWDHPGFTGSNPSIGNAITGTGNVMAATLGFNPIYGPWDVDNDGNGIHDSVWIDIGLPVQQHANGQLYKPLVAILCTDMDGRININAAGNFDDLPAAVATGGRQAGATGVGNTLTWSSESHGQGYGPFEIDLSKVLVSGGGPAVLNQRFQANQEVLDSTAPFPNDRWRVTQLSSIGPGRAQIDDDSDFAYRQFGSDASPFDATTWGYFGTPEDIRGYGLTVIDHNGQVDFLSSLLGIHNPGLIADLRVDDPYETNLVDSNGRDLAFNLADLEAVLRFDDYDDVTMSARINPSVMTANERGSITTHSFSVPAPSMHLPMEFRNSLATAFNASTANIEQYALAVSPVSFVDYVRFKIIDNDPSLTEATRTEILQETLPFELLHGNKFDINRPFGDGADGIYAVFPFPALPSLLGQNGIVDEPGEWLVNDPMKQLGLLFLNDHGVTGTGSGSGLFGGGQALVPDPAEIFTDASQFPTSVTAPVRQLYARHLFCLAMSLWKDDSTISGDSNFPTTLPSPDPETIRAIAQWAVNVVDFRDPDSIMTPFEYDPEPFDSTGWDVDGDLTTATTPPGNVVWGCERPELLITETLAWHDRRTEDDAVGMTVSDPIAPDNDFDQLLLPQSAFFVELYNPWTAEGAARHPRELYSSTGTLDLRNTTPSGDPVWRLVTARGDYGDPDSPANTRFATSDYADNDIRRVYFTTTVPTFESVDGAYAAVAGTPAPFVDPGRYAVIGSSGQYVGGAYVSPVGLSTSSGNVPTALAATRRVELQPTSPTDSRQSPEFIVPAADNGASTAASVTSVYDPPAAADVQDCSVGIIDGLSITEPIGGYTAPSASGVLVTPEDEPLDLQSASSHSNPDISTDITTQIYADGTSLSYRRVYLQRLADPTIDYDAETNPYRTIDSSEIDLTSFNGIDVASGATDPLAPTSPIAFRSKERGTFSADGRWLWTVEPPTGIITASPEEGDGSNNIATPVHEFPYLLRHSLGFLNNPYRRNEVTGTLTAFESTTANLPNASYIGSPLTGVGTPAFATFPWNNRPFVSQYELTLVPKTSSLELLRQFTLRDDGNFAGYSHFGPGAPTVSPFQLYLNFFGNVDRQDGGATGLRRIFDLAHVPSRYLGTQEWFGDDTVDFTIDPFTSSIDTLLGGQSSDAFTFRPPFNKVSRFRDPGKVNLNTIPNADVWDAVVAGNGPPSPAWNDVELSIRKRQDSAPPFGSSADITVPDHVAIPGMPAAIGHLDPNHPTQFLNPFRPSNSATMGTAVDPALAEDLETYASRFRPKTDSLEPLLITPNITMYRNTDRTPEMYFRSLQRLENMTTTQSNVYAVWITIGYFSVAKGTVDAAHPDGYYLGPELGSEIGEVERHRGFYMIDRSIPVGFEPGEDHNVDDTIILQRTIQ